jgi:hypothetical protein
VHALLAAAVDDPLLLERLRRQAATQRNGSPLDLERVRLFAGLAVKVRQNDVRLSLPLTFKLLDKLKISLALFAAYATPAAALRQANKKSRADKREAISRFIETWLSPDDPDHALARDMLHHECALLDCNAHHAATTVTPATVNPTSVPRRAAGLIHHEMSCDPLALARLLRSPDGALASLQRGQLHYLYGWDARRGGITVRQLDELGHILLTLADGRTSVARLAQALRQAGIAVTRAELCGATQKLVDDGILLLRP